MLHEENQGYNYKFPMVWPTRGGKKAMVADNHTKLLVARCGEMASVAPLRVRPLRHSIPVTRVSDVVTAMRHSGET